jgi:hypothetical protein
MQIDQGNGGLTIELITTLQKKAPIKLDLYRIFKFKGVSKD